MGWSRAQMTDKNTSNAVRQKVSMPPQPPRGAFEEAREIIEICCRLLTNLVARQRQIAEMTAAEDQRARRMNDKNTPIGVQREGLSLSTLQASLRGRRWDGSASFRAL